MCRLTDLLSWEDPFATSWLYVMICAIFLTLVVVPMEFILYVIVYYAVRVLGFVAFGPWMYFVGHHLARHAYGLEKEEMLFASQSRREQKKRLQEHRDNLVHAQLKRVIARAGAGKARLKRKADFLRSKRDERLPILKTRQQQTGGVILSGAPPIPSRSTARRGVIKPLATYTIDELVGTPKAAASTATVDLLDKSNAAVGKQDPPATGPLALV